MSQNKKGLLGGTGLLVGAALLGSYLLYKSATEPREASGSLGGTDDLLGQQGFDVDPNSTPEQPRGNTSNYNFYYPPETSIPNVPDAGTPISDPTIYPADAGMNPLVEGALWGAGWASATVGIPMIAGSFKPKVPAAKILDPVTKKPFVKEEIKDAAKPKDLVKAEPKDIIKGKEVSAPRVETKVEGKVAGKAGRIATKAGTVLAIGQLGVQGYSDVKQYKPETAGEYAGTAYHSATTYLSDVFAFGTGLVYRPQGADKSISTGWFASEKDIFNTLKSDSGAGTKALQISGLTTPYLQSQSTKPVNQAASSPVNMNVFNASQGIVTRQKVTPTTVSSSTSKSNTAPKIVSVTNAAAVKSPVVSIAPKVTGLQVGASGKNWSVKSTGKSGKY